MNNNILADRLKNMRKENGITQIELAKRLGVAKSVIAGAETKRGISKNLASKLAEFFETDIEYWINENADKEFIKEMPFLETTKNVMQRLINEKVLTLDTLDLIENDEDINKLILQSLKFDAKIALKKKEQN
ncbi:helix-turn-helix protein [Clostridium saccharobutylicum]|uniref:helix-turn-helix domain-containing protein n=1 Tax=Clostridium saccharobutylicum TaxID=169679 RepID=UPI00098C8F92|nr:helix-turn-helix transcriptional regulator [Clostridium saccharobutylicum]OOM17154.1 helix-turn-helix protein [Clostridium saccharobutylicum]